MGLRTSISQVYQYSVIGMILVLRLNYVFLIQHQWRDIQNGILPALNCFYCNPQNAPYGILWWIVSLPLRFNYAGLTAIIDVGVMLLIRTRLPLFPVYALMSWWLWLQAPYDLPIIWFTLLGLVSWPLVMLGPLAKIPLGAPASVWNYVTTRPYSGNDLEYYGFMGIVFIIVLVQIGVDYARQA